MTVYFEDGTKTRIQNGCSKLRRIIPAEPRVCINDSSIAEKMRFKGSIRHYDIYYIDGKYVAKFVKETQL